MGGGAGEVLDDGAEVGWVGVDEGGVGGRGGLVGYDWWWRVVALGGGCGGGIHHEREGERLCGFEER